MKNINSYLTFNGNCREAMQFYKECLGGELIFQTIGESPLSEQMPEKMKDCILHSTLTIGNLVIMATDMTPQTGRIKGNNISIMLDCESDNEIKSLYDNLSAGGNSIHPLENTFWGAIIGDLTDKYGNQWILNFTKQSIKNN
ncbi:MAG: VOC family protein [Bacteroidia bacterium]|nr:VOC family protein [Bacteroidia bacterium]